MKFVTMFLALFLVALSCGKEETITVDCVHGCPGTDTKTSTDTGGVVSPNGGAVGPVGPMGPPAEPCTISSTGLMTCGKDSYQIPAGAKGQTGAIGAKGDTGTNGTDGVNGHSVVFVVTTASAVQCPTGGSIIIMAKDINDNNILDAEDSNTQSAIVCNGATGSTGATGAKGDTGTAGTNGTNGADGAKGDTGATGPAGPTTAFTPVSLIRPCGEASSPWKEVLLCLKDGTLLADFSDNASGLNTRLAVIPPGSYIDTDQSSCLFNVNTFGSGLLVSWSAGSNQYSSWTAQSVYCGP